MERQRATVVHEVADPSASGEMVYDEPKIQLANGQIVVPIHVDRHIPKGTEGWAEYVLDRNAWRFTPDYEA